MILQKSQTSFLSGVLRPAISMILSAILTIKLGLNLDKAEGMLLRPEISSLHRVITNAVLMKV